VLRGRSPSVEFGGHDPGPAGGISRVESFDGRQPLEAQLEDNLGASGWVLDADQAKALDRASRQPLPYPHSAYLAIGI
jgi:hypothetical protein